MVERKIDAGVACAKVLKLSGKTITRIQVAKLSTKTQSRRDARSAIVSTHLPANTKKSNICYFSHFPTAIITSVAFYAYAWLF